MTWLDFHHWILHNISSTVLVIKHLLNFTPISVNLNLVGDRCIVKIQAYFPPLCSQECKCILELCLLHTVVEIKTFIFIIFHEKFVNNTIPVFSCSVKNYAFSFFREMVTTFQNARDYFDFKRSFIRELIKAKILIAATFSWKKMSRFRQPVHTTYFYKSK